MAEFLAESIAPTTERTGRPTLVTNEPLIVH